LYKDGVEGCAVAFCSIAGDVNVGGLRNEYTRKEKSAH